MRSGRLSRDPRWLLANYTHIAAATGYPSLLSGQPVEVEWEQVEQDGYDYRAVRVWPAGQLPTERSPTEPESSGAYVSTLTIEFDTTE